MHKGLFSKNSFTASGNFFFNGGLKKSRCKIVKIANICKKI